MRNFQRNNYIKEFGFLLYLQVLFIKIIRRILPSQLKGSLYKLEQTIKKRKLKKILNPKLQEMLSIVENTSISYTERIPKKIWVFWWQGNQKEIPLVDFCISSVIKNKPKGSEVTILTKDNLEKYCNIENHIMQKVEAGIITLTHFSDIVRVSVLAEQGGVWLDATIFAASNFSTIFQEGIWSIKKPDVKQKYIPKGRWSIYAIGAPKNSILIILMRELFNWYWTYHSSMLDYFLVDYCMDYLYDTFPEIRSMIDDIPENNQQVLFLQKKLGHTFTTEILSPLFVDTQLFKLSWKEQVALEKDGVQTVLGWLMTNSDLK